MESWKLEPAHDHGMPFFQGLRSLRRENGLVATGMHLAWWGLVRGYMRLWHRLKVHGRRNIPEKAPFVLVANHASHLDAMVLASPLPWNLRDRVFPIAAGDVFFETPMRSAFSSFFLNALPMWRKKCGPHALKELRQRLLEEPCGYVLFPEGGRSRDGLMQPFKNGLGMLVAETSVPVVPCYLQGCFEAMRPGCVIPRPRKIHMRVGPPLVFADVKNDRAGWEHIGAAVERAVRGLAIGRSTVC